MRGFLPAQTAAALLGSILCGTIAFAAGAVQIGQPAPAFTAADSKGAPVSLNQYRGRVVVLEWTNADCPYTHKHYASGNMQAMQALAQKNGAVQYMGGIDSIATADAGDIPNAEPYLKEAMLAVAAGRPVAHAVTRPYGCAVKY